MAYTTSRHPHSLPVRAIRCAYAHAGSAPIDNPSSSVRGRGPQMADQPPASSDVLGVALRTSLRGASPAPAGGAPLSASVYSGRDLWIAPPYLLRRCVERRDHRATHSLFPVEGASAHAPSTTEPLPIGAISNAPPTRIGGGSVVERSTDDTVAARRSAAFEHRKEVNQMGLCRTNE